jgi:hypothetical protein
VLVCRHLHRTSISTSTRLRNPRKTRRMGRQQRAVSEDSLKLQRGIGKGHAQEGDRRMRAHVGAPARVAKRGQCIHARHRSAAAVAVRRALQPGREQRRNGRLVRARVGACLAMGSPSWVRGRRGLEGARPTRRPRHNARANAHVIAFLLVLWHLPTHARSNLARPRVRALL